MFESLFEWLATIKGWRWLVANPGAIEVRVATGGEGM
jgi:hypothetical protein